MTSLLTTSLCAGKTFLGVKMLQVLLANTRNSQHVARRDMDKDVLLRALDDLVGARDTTGK